MGVDEVDEDNHLRSELWERIRAFHSQRILSSSQVDGQFLRRSEQNTTRCLLVI